MKIEIAIGDVHGRFDKLQELFNLVNEKYADTEKMGIMLGDYVDRGPQSAEVVAELRACQSSSFHCLKGNHEQLMIDGLEIRSAEYLWSINGGHATMTSYANLYGNEGQANIEKMLEDKDWMKSLPTMVQTEHRIYVHAGLNPRRRSLEDQRDEEVMWIRDPFLMSTYDWGKHVVHGHTHTWGRKEIGDVERLPTRTNLDTGAFHTGILSAAIFDTAIPGGPIEIIQTKGN